MDKNTLLSYFFKNKIVQQLIVVSILLVVELSLFYEELYAGLASENSIWFHLLKIVLFLSASYINYLLLIPSFLKRKKYAWFIICSLINLSIFSFLVFIVSILSFEGVSISRGNAFEHHVIYTLSLMYTGFIIIGSTLFYFIKEWIKLKDASNRLGLVEKEKIESEHNVLKAQLNPHFLFNTLNNIYTLSLTSDENLPGIILQLSDLMSYILYEGKRDEVPLQKELSFIKNYIELEQIRSKKTKVVFNYNPVTDEIMIAPLLFIPFVENAFKHSKSDTGSSYIKIDLSVGQNSILLFHCENTIGNKTTDFGNKFRGVGLENVKKRLELLYRGKHNLIISEDSVRYKVELTINFKGEK